MFDYLGERRLPRTGKTASEVKRGHWKISDSGLASGNGPAVPCRTALRSMPQGAANQRCVAIVYLVGSLCSGVKTERMGELTGESSNPLAALADCQHPHPISAVRVYGFTAQLPPRQVQDNGPAIPQGLGLLILSANTGIGLAQLASGDWLSIIRTGTAQYARKRRTATGEGEHVLLQVSVVQRKAERVLQPMHLEQRIQPAILLIGGTAGEWAGIAENRHDRSLQRLPAGCDRTDRPRRRDW
ncbi:hypothetical protein EV128_11615 [Rhizobium azibense]|nr:hypothetical protein EV128_11615 [Rhizobium azibense]